MRDLYSGRPPSRASFHITDRLHGYARPDWREDRTAFRGRRFRDCAPGHGRCRGTMAPAIRAKGSLQTATGVPLEQPVIQEKEERFKISFGP